MCLLTVLFLCSNTVDVYTWYAASYGNIEGFLESHDKNYSSSIGAAMSVLLVQIFFCHRIVLIKRAAWPFALAIVLVSVQFGDSNEARPIPSIQLAIVQCAAGLALGILFRLGATEVDNSRHALSRHFNEATIIACVVNAILVSAVTSYVVGILH